MRLINTSSGAFEEFIGGDIPKYAILSHTWEEEEVSYQDYLGGAFSHKKGYNKVKKPLELARLDNIQYVWIDTCNIDKRSSAELTEAINSMYQWYQRSQVCYAYLSDLEAGAELDTQLQKCRWFTRGWTLQELIAPLDVLFFDQQWNQVGTKTTLCHQLSHITGIDLGTLSNDDALSSICVARKMSWAAKRETTRIEDMAYCLLGLFDVNMPLLYGEESKAFRRLQEEIIKMRPDFSIFAWKDEPSSLTNPLLTNPNFQFYCGILAKSPVPFEHAGSFQAALFGGLFIDFSISNNGVKTNSIFRADVNVYILPLYCRTTEGTNFAVRLRKVGPDTFVRDSPHDLYAYKDNVVRHLSQKYKYILIEQPPTIPLARALSTLPECSWTLLSVSSSRRHFLRIQLEMDDSAFKVRTHRQPIFGCFDSGEDLFFTPDGDRTDCAGMSFTVDLFDDSIIPKTVFEEVFTVLTLGWSTNIDTVQYTVIDALEWRKEISILGQLVEQGANTQTQLLQMVAFWGIPKVSNATFPILGSSQSFHICLEPVIAERTIRVKCSISPTKDVTCEGSGRWDW